MAVDNHTFVNALPWMRRTGAPRRDPPERYGKWTTVCRRFNRRSGNGATGRPSTALREGRTIGAKIRVPAMDPTSVYGQINVYGVTTKSERHKRSYWTRTADGNGIGGRKAPVPYGS